jgi:SpoVK/Ycf46/Vps4 family AAA+-type ATPase
MAEAVAPCILWLDELEKGLSGSGSSNFSDGGTSARVFGSFVTWMQEKKAPVFVIATSNDVSQLPPELLRKGRFDEAFFVDLPTLPERREIVAIHLRKRKRDASKFEVDALAEKTDGMSGAEVEQAVVSAMFDAFDEGVEVETRHIVKAMGEIVPLSKTMKEKIRDLRVWCHNRARPASSLYVDMKTSGRAIEMDDTRPPEKE